MWIEIKPKACVLLEMPGRWYVGIVEERTSLTVRLAAPALCVHDTGDLGLFLDGKGTAASGMEATPLPRGKELSLANLDGAEAYPVEFFLAICKRTHSPKSD